MDAATSPRNVWDGFFAGWSAVDIDDVRFVLRPAQPGDDLPVLPDVLKDLWIITSDNPGGLLRSMSLNVERRSELRVEMVTQQMLGRCSTLYPTLGAMDGAWENGEVGLATRCSRELAVDLGHGFGQLAVYHLSALGRSLVPCIRRASVDQEPQPMVWYRTEAPSRLAHRLRS